MKVCPVHLEPLIKFWKERWGAKKRGEMSSWFDFLSIASLDRIDGKKQITNWYKISLL